MTDTVLAVENLSVTTKDGTPIVTDVSFTLDRGGSLGLVGESGSGKTVTGLAVLGELPKGLRVSAGSISMPGTRPTRRRRRRVAMVFQNPMTSLNPLMRVGIQVAEAHRINHGLDRAAARRASIDALARVGLPDPELNFRQFPHELSGGQRQRAMIAIALACDAEVLIADEPTTALDVSVQSAIMKLLLDLQREDGLAVLFVSHDLPLVAGFCQQLAVLYAGEIVESGPTRQLIRQPEHPYLSALLNCIPTRGAHLVPIPGVVPEPGSYSTRCRFLPRCPHGDEQAGCAEPQVLLPVNDDRSVRCVRHSVLDLPGPIREPSMRQRIGAGGPPR